ncbi:MAG TPA: DUF4349 domain-containing protein [Micromonosporaceae bacterium]|nr:DUF4349 domain-containing protein [Micromonosporaceae bacterium]
MGQTRRRRLAAALGAVAMITAMALSGCGSGAQSDRAPAPAQDDQAGGREGADADGPAGPGAQDQPAGKDTPADLRVNQRMIIYTGSIVLRVENVDEAAGAATSIAETAGGFVGGDQRGRDDSHSSATLELRVPADKFSGIVDQVARLGKQVRRDIDTKDVTEETLDLDARIATQRARVESGRRLLEQATTLNELILLEGELAKREADLAALEARKRRLNDLTALSTITVTLLGPDARDSKPEEPETGFMVGLRGGWNAFLVSTKILLTVLGALLPFLIGIGGPVLVVVWLVRRLRSRRPRPHQPVTPAAPPLPPRPPWPVGAPPPGPIPTARPPQAPVARQPASDQSPQQATPAPQQEAKAPPPQRADE